MVENQSTWVYPFWMIQKLFCRVSTTTMSRNQSVKTKSSSLMTYTGSASECHAYNMYMYAHLRKGTGTWILTSIKHAGIFVMPLHAVRFQHLILFLLQCSLLNVGMAAPLPPGGLAPQTAPGVRHCIVFRCSKPLSAVYHAKPRWCKFLQMFCWKVLQQVVHRGGRVFPRQELQARQA